MRALIAALTLIAVAVMLWFSYQAGWDARQTRAARESAATLAANREVAQSASHALSYQLGQNAAADARIETILAEIETYETAADPDRCGVAVERLRLLEQIR